MFSIVELTAVDVWDWTRPLDGTDDELVLGDILFLDALLGRKIGLLGDGDRLLHEAEVKERNVFLVELNAFYRKYVARRWGCRCAGFFFSSSNSSTYVSLLHTTNSFFRL